MDDPLRAADDRDNIQLILVLIPLLVDDPLRDLSEVPTWKRNNSLNPSFSG